MPNTLSTGCGDKVMPLRKPTKDQRKSDDPAQSKRFIETAKEVEADDGDALEQTLKKISSNRRRPAEEK